MKQMTKLLFCAVFALTVLAIEAKPTGILSADNAPQALYMAADYQPAAVVQAQDNAVQDYIFAGNVPQALYMAADDQPTAVVQAQDNTGQGDISVGMINRCSSIPLPAVIQLYGYAGRNSFTHHTASRTGSGKNAVRSMDAHTLVPV